MPSSYPGREPTLLMFYGLGALPMLEDRETLFLFTLFVCSLVLPYNAFFPAKRNPHWTSE